MMPLLQSVLEPRGEQAAAIATLWWVLLGVCTAVWLAVMVALTLALVRPRRTAAVDVSGGEPRKQLVVGAAALATAAILVVFVAYSVVVARAGSRTPADAARPVHVVVTAHQWWWEIEYADAMASRRFKTANELRVPVGRPVIVELLSRDVIHSFWVPSLHGKIDAVPGRRNHLWFEAAEPGEYRGQCAEFCGLQHAKMAFVVVAMTDGDFEAWADANRAPAAAPATDETRRGAEVFTRASCVMCHTVRGTGAWGMVAPDLTHVAGRRTLAAAALPNTRGALTAWILDPQHVKPGTPMPPSQFAPDDLHALVSYLRSLE